MDFYNLLYDFQEDLEGCLFNKRLSSQIYKYEFDEDFPSKVIFRGNDCKGFEPLESRRRGLLMRQLIKNGNVQGLERHLKNGMDPNFKRYCSSNTPLIKAMERCYWDRAKGIKMTQLLLDHGGDPYLLGKYRKDSFKCTRYHDLRIERDPRGSYIVIDLLVLEDILFTLTAVIKAAVLIIGMEENRN